MNKKIVLNKTYELPYALEEAVKYIADELAAE